MTDHICRRNLKIQSHSLKLYFRTGQSSPYNFPCVSLVTSKAKQVRIKEAKRTNYSDRLEAKNLYRSIST